MRTSFALIVLVAAFATAPAVRAAAPTEPTVEAAAQRLLELLADPSPAAAQALRE
ncbi:MAG: hypothetical protein IAG13_22155, partial [Deltaproteobacteria bacterium]|nr:hypothetical protein [Nannocystaceae bacterium]